MISILIPNFNYAIQDLVNALLAQLNKEEWAWEILIRDDASSNTELQKTNREFVQSLNLENVQYIIGDKNIGNGLNRNTLADLAQYEWLLFLDTDMVPVHSDFIKKYITQIEKEDAKVYSGGIIYKKEWREKYPLKYLHGKTETNDKGSVYNDYLLFRGNNFMIPKSEFSKVRFQTFVHTYGYVDTIFGMRLKEQNIPFKAFDNPAYHLDKVSANDLIEKKKMSLDNLAYLYQNKRDWVEDFKIIKTYEMLNKLKATPLVSKLISLLEPMINKNLKGQNPNFYVLQLFQLGYFIRTLHAMHNRK